MDIKANPKLGCNKFLQKVNSTHAMDEIIWRNMLVTMYRTTRRHIRENVQFLIRNVNDATLTDNIV